MWKLEPAITSLHEHYQGSMVIPLSDEEELGSLSNLIVLCTAVLKRDALLGCSELPAISIEYQQALLDVRADLRAMLRE